MREVDAFRSAVRDTFLGVSEPAVRSDDVRGKQFSTHDPGFDKTRVDAFVEAAGLRLAAMESTDGPPGALVGGAILVGWAEWVESTGFHPPPGGASEISLVGDPSATSWATATPPPIAVADSWGG